MRRKEIGLNLGKIEYRSSQLLYFLNDPPPPFISIQTAQLFAEVFSGHPWYERMKCSECDSYFKDAHPEGTICADCKQGLITPAYPIDKTTLMINDIFLKPNHRMFLIENGGIVGFAWGYTRSAEETVNRFGPHAEEALNQIRSLSNNSSLIFTAAEIGIRENMRGKGYGKLLLTKLLEQARVIQAPVTIWTRSDTILAPICLKMGFTQIFGPELILVQGKSTLTGNKLIGLDKNTPERILFLSI